MPLSNTLQIAERYFTLYHLGTWVYFPDTGYEQWSQGLKTILEVENHATCKLTEVFSDLEEHLKDVLSRSEISAQFELMTSETHSPAGYYSFILDVQYKDIQGTPLQVTAYIQQSQAPQITSSELFKTVFGSFAKLPCTVVFMTDSRGRYTFLEGIGLQVLGIQPSLWLGKSIFDFLKHSPNHEEYCSNIRKAMNGASLFTQSEFGGRHFVDRLCPVYGPRGDFQGLVGIQIETTDAAAHLE